MRFFVLLFLGSLVFGTIAGFSPLPGVSFYIHDIALLLLFTAALISCFRKKRFITPKLFVPILIFLGIGAISLILNSFRISSSQLFQSSLYLARWGSYAGVYVIFVQAFIPVSVWLWGLASVGFVFAVLGFLQYIFYPYLQNLSYLGWDPHYYRLFSTLLDPNFVGILLVLAIFLTLYIRKLFRKNWIVFPIIIETIALYLTYSRSSYLALIIGIGYLILRSSKIPVRGVVAILMGIFLVIVLPKPGGDTLRFDRIVSTVARFNNWQQSMQKIAGSPVIGFGFNTLRFVFPSNAGHIDLFSRASAGVDSSILFIFLTTGIAGFFAYAYLAIKEVRMIRENIFFASLIAVFVHSMFNNSLFYPWVMIWLWVLAGAVETTDRHLK